MNSYSLMSQKSRFARFSLAWSHGSGGSNQKLCSNPCAAGKSANDQSSGGSASPVRCESVAPLLPKLPWGAQAAASTDSFLERSEHCSAVALSADRRGQI